MRICADGGANRIFDEMSQMTYDQDYESTRNRFIPEIIEGDMDSIRPEVKRFYSSQGSKISDKSHNQETTDLHKCISSIRHRTPSYDKSNLCILVTGALGGRFDLEAANINVLYAFSDMRIVLLSDGCLIQLLPKTHHHEIYIDSSVEGPHCELFPIGAPSMSTTTTGLKWNLPEAKMRFGSMISTSNIVNGEKVTVQSDADLLWAISLRNLNWRASTLFVSYVLVLLANLCLMLYVVSSALVQRSCVCVQIPGCRNRRASFQYIKKV